MGSIDRRLEALERAGGTTEDEEERTRAEALSRLTDEDLELLTFWLDRTIEEGGEPTEAEGGALRRYEELEEEVRHERGV